MAAIRDHGKGSARISTNFTYTRVKAIPDLNLSALHRTHSAGSVSMASARSSCTPSEKQEHRHIREDEPCFITKRPGYALRKVHWVSAVRKDRATKAAAAVQAFLSALRVVTEPFNLNSASNLAPMDPELHYTLDKLGFFAVTCSEPTLSAILDLVQKENEKSDRTQQQYIRFFEFTDAPFSTAEYEFVLLHGDHFRPAGSTLAVHTFELGEGTRLAGKLYMVGEDGALRERRTSASPRFPAFKAPSRAKQFHCVNPFLVVLNADMAFRRFRKSGFFCACPDYQKLVDLTIAVADAIYHWPIAQMAAKKAQDASELADLRACRQTDGDTQRNDDMVIGTDFNSAGQSDLPTLKALQSIKQTLALDSRFGAEIATPGPNASPEEVRDYYCYLISGRDEPLTRRGKGVLISTGLYFNNGDEDNEDASDSDEEEDGGELCIGDKDADATTSIEEVASSTERVRQWRSATVTD